MASKVSGGISRLASAGLGGIKNFGGHQQAGISRPRWHQKFDAPPLIRPMPPTRWHRPDQNQGFFSTRNKRPAGFLVLASAYQAARCGLVCIKTTHSCAIRPPHTAVVLTAKHRRAVLWMASVRCFGWLPAEFAAIDLKHKSHHPSPPTGGTPRRARRAPAVFRHGGSRDRPVARALELGDYLLLRAAAGTWTAMMSLFMAKMT